MNDRIKELASQCWDRRLDGMHFDQEKFAELIVRECAKRSKELGQLEIGLGILKHFGVEE